MSAPPTDIQKNMMEKIFAQILLGAQKSGLSLVILFGAIWWFQLQHDKLEIKVDSCQAELIESYKETNLMIIDIIDQNCESMNNFSHVMMEYKEDRK